MSPYCSVIRVLECGGRIMEPVIASFKHIRVLWMRIGSLFSLVVVQALSTVLWQNANLLHYNAHPFRTVLLFLLLAILVRGMDERRYVVHGTRYYALDSASTEKRTIPPRIYSYHSVVVVGEVSWRLDRVWTQEQSGLAN